MSDDVTANAPHATPIAEVPGSDTQVFGGIAGTAREPVNDSILAAHDIYPSTEFGSRQVAAAQRAIREAIAELTAAIDAMNAGDPMEGDDRVNHARAAIAEAFAAYSISDGFGIIVTGVTSALQNLGGSILTVPQLAALRSVLRCASAEPFLAPDRAAEQTMQLENTGLTIEPPGLVQLVGWLADDA